MSPSKIKKTMRSVSQLTSVDARVIDVQATTATVRLSGRGRVLHGLKVMGGPVQLNDLVRVTYSNGIPYISAISPRVESSAPALSPAKDVPVSGSAPIGWDLLSSAGWALDSTKNVYNQSMTLKPGTGLDLGSGASSFHIGMDGLNASMWGGAAAKEDALLQFTSGASWEVLLGDPDGIHQVIDPTNGLRFMNSTTNLFQVNTTGEIRVGAVGNDYLHIDSGVLAFRTQADTPLFTIDGPNEKVTVGLPPAMRFDSNGAYFLYHYGGVPTTKIMFVDSLSDTGYAFFTLQGIVNSSASFSGEIKLPAFAGALGDNNHLLVAAYAPTGSSGKDATLDFHATHEATISYIMFKLGNQNRFQIGNASLVLNEDSNDIDFRVEGNTYTNLLFCDAGLDAVGIKCNPASGNALEVDAGLAIFHDDVRALALASGDLTNDVSPGRISTKYSDTIAGATSDAYAATLGLNPGYTAGSAQTVTRHNYINISNPTPLTNITLTDACVLRFDAAAGTHKAVDSGTTKTTPGTVNAWVKINVSGTIYYLPAYTSKTS